MDTDLDLNQILTERLHVSHADIAAFCDRWHVAEFALFGSVLRDDFDSEHSDVDVLVRFKPEARKGITEWLAMQDELTALFERKVDLISQIAIEESHNWIRKRNILASAQVVYGS